MDPTDVVVLGDDRILGDLILRNLQRRGYVARWAPPASVHPAHHDHILLRTSRAAIVDVNGPDAQVWQLAQQPRWLETITPTALLVPVVTCPDQRRLAELAPGVWLRKPYCMHSLISLLSTRCRGPALPAALRLQ